MKLLHSKHERALNCSEFRVNDELLAGCLCELLSKTLFFKPLEAYSTAFVAMVALKYKCVAFDFFISHKHNTTLMHSHAHTFAYALATHTHTHTHTNTHTNSLAKDEHTHTCTQIRTHTSLTQKA